MAHPLHLNLGLVVVFRIRLQHVLNDGGIGGYNGLLDAAKIEPEAVYFERTCTGLWAIARESRKERNRETAGTLCGKVTPRYPSASGERDAV
ncbi:MAG: hypothetical protein ABSF85_00275 [Terriglobales bacterium]